MIPQHKWKWYGSPLHFICAHKCQYHKGTLVGKYVISTVGRYFDHSGTQCEVGHRRWGETYVFDCIGIRDCGCPDISGSEIDSAGYTKDAECRDYDAGHMAMCMKYAEMQEDESDGQL